MMSENNNLSEALAVGHAIGERVGYFLDAHSAENHPGLLHEALTRPAADWFRQYANLSKNLKEFKKTYRDVRKTISKNSSLDLKSISNSQVKEYFMSDPKLKEIWEQHDKDVAVCFNLFENFNYFVSVNKTPNGSNDSLLLDFSKAYLNRLVLAGQRKFVPMYFDDTLSETIEPVGDNVDESKKVKFTTEHCRLIFIYFIDEDTDMSREEPWFLLEDESIDNAVARFKQTFKGIYHEPDGVSCSNLIEFDRKVRVWAD